MIWFAIEQKYLRLATGFGLASGSLYLTYSAINNQEKFFSDYVMPLVHLATDGETAHNLAVKMAKYGLVPRASSFEDEHILVSWTAHSDINYEYQFNVKY